MVSVSFPSYNETEMISYAQFLEMQARVSKRVAEHGGMSFGEQGEIPLHNSIIRYCNQQWPKWKFIHSRTDRRPTIAVGAQDFTIFMPDGKVLCIECKDRNEKPTSDQQTWATEMRMLGHTVHVVRSMNDFMTVLHRITYRADQKYNPHRNGTDHH